MRQQPVATIVYGTEYMDLYSDGSIGRPSINMRPSGEWKVTGAVTLNNFGFIEKHYDLEQILRNPQAIPWKFKNGKQRTHITDLDHGTRRQWNSPTHCVYVETTAKEN